jgi:hypothetical protein
MKKYFGHLQDTKTPHERREVALRIAGVLTALVFVVWLSTFGVRLALDKNAPAQNIQNTAATLVPVDASTTPNQF